MLFNRQTNRLNSKLGGQNVSKNMFDKEDKRIRVLLAAPHVVLATRRRRETCSLRHRMVLATRRPPRNLQLAELLGAGDRSRRNLQPAELLAALVISLPRNLQPAGACGAGDKK